MRQTEGREESGSGTETPPGEPGSLPSRPALAAVVVWVAAAGLIQWAIYGPFVDLQRLTGLPLGFVVETWRPALQRLLTAPLGT